jgi:hypothetical protein
MKWQYQVPVSDLNYVGIEPGDVGELLIQAYTMWRFQIAERNNLHRKTALELHATGISLDVHPGRGRGLETDLSDRASPVARLHRFKKSCLKRISQKVVALHIDVVQSDTDVALQFLPIKIPAGSSTNYLIGRPCTRRPYCLVDVTA